MSVAYPARERYRTRLAEAIVAALKSWPALHRQVFVLSHYAGHTPAQIAQSFGLGAEEVHSILDLSGESLRAALRAWSHAEAGWNAGLPHEACEKRIAC